MNDLPAAPMHGYHWVSGTKERRPDYADAYGCVPTCRNQYATRRSCRHAICQFPVRLDLWSLDGSPLLSPIHP